MKYNRILQIIFMISIFSLIGILTACGSSNFSQTENTVAPWTPQSEESQELEQLLTNDKNTSIVSYTADENFQSVNLGLRYYEHGKLVSDEDMGAAALNSDESAKEVSHGLFSISRSEKNFEMSRSCHGKDGSVTVTSVSNIEIPGYKKDDDDYSFAVGELTEESTFEEGKPVYLLSYYNTQEGETYAYDPQTLMEDADALKANEKTWVIYAVFSNKPLE